MEEEKVKIAADKKEEVNIRGNKEKRCELQGGGRRAGGMQRKRKTEVIEKRYWLVQH